MVGVVDDQKRLCFLCMSTLRLKKCIKNSFLKASDCFKGKREAYTTDMASLSFVNTVLVIKYVHRKTAENSSQTPIYTHKTPPCRFQSNNSPLAWKRLVFSDFMIRLPIVAT